MTESTLPSGSARSLELYFIDGKPDGMLTAEVFNWTGHVLMTPRTQIADALKRSEAKRTGVYFLFGERDGESLAYIGEAEEIGQRLRGHLASKDWWTSCILVTTTGDGLHKAHVRYLEARLLEIAREVGSLPLENQNRPARSSLSEAHVANMEVFLDTLLMVLPALRVDMFVNKRRKQRKPDRTPLENRSPTFELTIKKHGITATAGLEDGEFVVREGSLARASWSGTQGKAHYGKLHQKLVDSGVLKPDGDRRIFDSDYAFASTSAAAAVVSGRVSAGPREWKVKGQTKSYKEWEAEQVASAQEGVCVTS